MAFGLMPAPSSIPGASTENPNQRWGFLHLYKRRIREVPELEAVFPGNRSCRTRVLGRGLNWRSGLRQRALWAAFEASHAPREGRPLSARSTKTRVSYGT